MTLKQRLAQLEARLQALIEGRAALGGYNMRELSARIVAAMHSGIQLGADGYLRTPSLFSLYLPPQEAERIQQNPNLITQLASQLHQAATEAGLQFDMPPTLRPVPDPTLTEGQFYVLAEVEPGLLGSTEAIPISTPAQPQTENAFLIVNGSQIYPLPPATINIGRRPDNHLTIDDPRVSRNHCQIRYANHQYTLFDLNATGGTFVNGQRIQQYPLKPGDVISLAGVPLVFGQDTPGDAAPTQEIAPPQAPESP